MNINVNSLPADCLPIVEASNVRKSYLLGSLEVPVLSGINLKIEKGEFLAIMGPSGSGKSTLMNLIGCLDRPTEGQVLIRGRNLHGMSDEELARLRGLEIGFVFQTFNLVPRLTALENVLLPTFANYRISSDPRKRAEELLETMGLQDRIVIGPENFQAVNLRGSQLHGHSSMTQQSFLRMNQQETLTPKQEPRFFAYLLI